MVDDAMREHFHQNGFAVLRRLLSEDEAEDFTTKMELLSGITRSTYRLETSGRSKKGAGNS